MIKSNARNLTIFDQHCKGGPLGFSVQNFNDAQCQETLGAIFLTTGVFNDFLTTIGAPLQRNGRAVKKAVEEQILTTLTFCARGSNIF